MLDVFSVAKYNSLEENRTWEVCPGNGFWREEEYIAINGLYKYRDTVSLEQVSIITAKENATYYLWTTYFTKEHLITEAQNAGFKAFTVFGDVAGTPYNEHNFTISILLEK